MRIRFAEAAHDELNEACEWFDQQQAGLGARFKREVREAALLIAKAPLLFPVELEDVRRYVMNRFSYTLRYVVRGEEIWILAVSHQHRRPDYWVDRTQEQ
ncbi:MAG: type II toxin-antitoxin system RelE/ParE family toxin [Sideroxydans sp.]|nr:type II toxin-antitoxin system RelE/ParE family toxin [Sideroxydans sp.]